MVLSLSILTVSAAHAAPPPLSMMEEPKLLWVPLNRVATFNLMSTEISQPFYSQMEGWVTPKLQTVVAPIDAKATVNPFALEDKDFAVGNHLPNPGEQEGPIPKISSISAKWFDDVVKNNEKLPDLFLIGGHHVISEGWHNQEENAFLYMPTMLETFKDHPNAKKVFGAVKLAILWGCNTMTNLEPHAEDGSYLNSQEIESIFKSGTKGENKMRGILSDGSIKTNSLEFYKSRLAREYGKYTKQYEYTRDPKEEKCIGKKPYENCTVTNLERIMPEKFLYDGEHIFNEPYRMKGIFPNAYLVLGFSSASPSEEDRAKILGKTLADARKELNKGLPAKDARKIYNVMYTITSEKTSDELRKRVIESVRKFWTINTFNMNGGRPSGSITPAYPELDKNGVFNVEVSKDTPLHLPYEKRTTLY